MAALGRTATLGALQYLLGVYASGWATSRNCFALAIRSSDLPIAAAADGGNFSGASGPAISADTWFHLAGVFTSNASRTTYTNGEPLDRYPLQNAEQSEPHIDGVGDGSSAASPFLGSVAEAGIWNVALAADEIAALAKGFSPKPIRPQNLAAYLPLVRDPETPVVEHRRHKHGTRPCRVAKLLSTLTYWFN